MELDLLSGKVIKEVWYDELNEVLVITFENDDLRFYVDAMLGKVNWFFSVEEREE